MKTDKIWICESVGKTKGMWKQGEEKMDKINIHNIYYLQRHVWSYGFTKVPVRGFDPIYEYGLEALPGKQKPSIKDHRK